MLLDVPRFKTIFYLTILHVLTSVLDMLCVYVFFFNYELYAFSFCVRFALKKKKKKRERRNLLLIRFKMSQKLIYNMVYVIEMLNMAS